MASGIKELDDFIRNDLKQKLHRAYRRHNILSEADMEAFAWRALRRFLPTLRRIDPGATFGVHCRPYLKDLRIHPDIIVFKNDRPWVVLELKETWKLGNRTAKEEADRLLACKKVYQIKRGYLFYLSRRRAGDGKKALGGPKGKLAYFFREVRIVLEEHMTKEALSDWEEKFRSKAKLIRTH